MAQTKQIGSHKTNVFTEDGSVKVVYHNTVVVKFGSGRIILDTGGYFTHTTKARMNQAACQFDLGYRVYQKDFNWFVEYQGRTIPFISNKVSFLI